jgi:hypothetical protein
VLIDMEVFYVSTNDSHAHRRNHPMGPVGRVPPNF